MIFLFIVSTVLVFQNGVTSTASLEICYLSYNMTCGPIWLELGSCMRYRVNATDIVARSTAESLKQEVAFSL